MKRLFLLGSLVLFSAASLTSCREEAEKETIVREVKVEKEAPETVEEEVEESEGALERAAKRVDKRVNEEIDEEIDRIGDDN